MISINEQLETIEANNFEYEQVSSKPSVKG